METYEDDLTEWYWNHQDKDLTEWLCIERVLNPGEDGKQHLTLMTALTLSQAGGHGIFRLE